MTNQQFRKLYLEAIGELDGYRPENTRDKALSFALILLAEDNCFYGTMEDLTYRNLCGHGCISPEFDSLLYYARNN